MRFRNRLLLLLVASFFVGNEAFSYDMGVNYRRDISKTQTTNITSGARAPYMNAGANGYYGNQYSYDQYYLSQYSTEYCISILLKALDKACYNDSDVQNGVYQDCASSSITDLSNAMDANLFYVVPSNQQEMVKTKCDAYKSAAIERFLSLKNNIEQNAKTSSYECQRAKDILAKAKDCHTQMISSSGSYFDTNKNCDSQVRTEFQRAGNMGASNVMGIVDNFTTGQFTAKNANWRQAVDAVLSGYMMKAKAACGVDDFNITPINMYSADSQTNSLQKQQNAYIQQAGINQANSGAGGGMIGGAGGAILNNNIFTAISSTIGQATGINKGGAGAKYGANTIDPSSSAGSKLDQQITGQVYTITTANLGVGASRLAMILDNPTSIDPSNPTDIEISTSIFGTAVNQNNMGSFVGQMNGMSGKTNIFIIKSAATGTNVCSVQKQSGSRLLPVDQVTAMQSSKLRSYVGTCSQITGL